MKKTVYVTSYAIKDVGGECDLSFAPPMMKRRFSPLQKVAFSLLNAVAPKGSAPKTVFASRDGEVKLTHELVGAFNAGDGVSPWKFSSSVYNAAPGLYSVYSGNRSTYTAIAAGDETIENSLIEAVLKTEVRPGAMPRRMAADTVWRRDSKILPRTDGRRLKSKSAPGIPKTLK